MGTIWEFLKNNGIHGNLQDTIEKDKNTKKQ